MNISNRTKRKKHELNRDCCSRRFNAELISFARLQILCSSFTVHSTVEQDKSEMRGLLDLKRLSTITLMAELLVFVILKLSLPLIACHCTRCATAVISGRTRTLGEFFMEHEKPFHTLHWFCSKVWNQNYQHQNYSWGCEKIQPDYRQLSRDSLHSCASCILSGHVC